MKSRRSRVVAGATLVLGLSACAGAPTAPTSATTGTAAIAPAAATAQTSREKAESPFPGYYARKARNGQTLYCREDGVAGTRIPKLVCATEDVLRNQSADSKQQIDDIRQAAGTGGCNPADGC
jgi:hypothetical protein